MTTRRSRPLEGTTLAERLPLVIAAGALTVIAGAFALLPRLETATGVVIAVDSASLTDVRGFTLRIAGGDSVEFVLGNLEDPVAFPPSHLAEHVATSSPVIVHYRQEGGRRVVFALEDAPGPSST